jgi:16S rRNA pseudouridine516 synthase
MHLADILFTQGFGTRRVCTGLIEQGHVGVIDRTHAVNSQENSPLAQLNRAQDAIDLIAYDLQFTVQGKLWRYHERAYVMLHKPAGYECSHKPGAWPSVYTLLPAPLRVRPNKNAIQGVQAVGRLDQDTTGLLLLSDDGQFIHRMSSPKHHVPKLYQVTCKHTVDDKQVAKLLAGVVLDDSPQPVRAAACVVTGAHTLDMTLTEGKYHQVKRMIAAVGNRVEGLHRASMGTLPLDVAVGEWRWLTAQEVAALHQSA